MATRTITIKPTHVAEMIEIFGVNYQTDIQDPGEAEGVTMPNPQTKADFAGEQFDAEIKTYISRKVQMYRDRAALATADSTEILE